MTEIEITLDGKTVTVPIVAHDEQGIWISVAALRDHFGWKLEPHGLCRADACIPRFALRHAIRDECIEINALARAIGLRPVISAPTDRHAARAFLDGNGGSPTSG